MTNLTRSAIKATLIKLLNDRPLSQITVKDIVSECGNNRNTFYYHYQGILELIREIVSDQAEAIIQNHLTLEILEDCMNAIVRPTLDERRAILHIYNSASRDVYEQYLWDVCGHVVSIHLNTVLNDRRLPDADCEILHQHYTCVAFGCVSWWLASGMKDDVLSDIHRISELQRDSLEQMVACSLGQEK